MTKCKGCREIEAIEGEELCHDCAHDRELVESMVDDPEADGFDEAEDEAYYAAKQS